MGRRTRFLVKNYDKLDTLFCHCNLSDGAGAIAPVQDACMEGTAPVCLVALGPFQKKRAVNGIEPPAGPVAGPQTALAAGIKKAKCMTAVRTA
jgi:hypothetical protein